MKQNEVNKKVCIGVIILNYLAYKTTIETVNSFLAQDSNGFEVIYVIVDNCSPNESYEKLCNEYKDNSNILVVKTIDNLGFAKGNNYGYENICEIFWPDFVIVSNDDILLPQPGLFQWIVDSYEKHQFGVLGPDVYSVKGKFHQSPMQNMTRDKRKLKKQLLNLRVQVIKCIVKHLFRFSIYSGIPTWKNEHYTDYSDKLTLHGSFQIFSKKYFEIYETPYDPSTFLYNEEDILKLRCDKKNIKMIYAPGYQIKHLQAVSTNMITNNPCKKELNRLKNCINSLKIFIKILESPDD